MTPHQTVLGTCPACDTPIPDHRLLIEYERRDGPAAYAECPGCRAVVNPD